MSRSSGCAATSASSPARSSTGCASFFSASADCARAISGSFAISAGSAAIAASASASRSAADQRANPAGRHRRMPGRHLGELIEDRQRAGPVALGQHLLAHRDQRREFGLGVAGLALDRQLREQLIEHRLHLRFGPRAGQIGGELALEHRIDGRDRSHLELRGDELVLVGVDLGQHDALVGIIGRDFFQHRRQRLARPAPFRPEIDDDELGHRRLDDIAAKRLDRFLF